MQNILEEAKKRLEADGGRMTSPRRMIIEMLQDMQGHPTAEELYQVGKRRDPNLHISTVYRTLRWLEQEGLVSTRFFDNDRQEHFDPCQTEEHYHFQCIRCKDVVEFNTLLVNAIKAQFELHSGAEVQTGTVILYGLCARCRQSD